MRSNHAPMFPLHTKRPCTLTYSEVAHPPPAVLHCRSHTLCAPRKRICTPLSVTHLGRLLPVEEREPEVLVAHSTSCPESGASLHTPLGQLYQGTMQALDGFGSTRFSRWSEQGRTTYLRFTTVNTSA